jgi:hypothetical protein
MLWLCSTALLALGLTRPVIQLAVNVESVLQDALDRQPVVGLVLQEHGLNITDIASKLPPTSFTQQSIVSSAIKLYRVKCPTAATLILLFSIIMPIGKQAVFLAMLLAPRGSSQKLGSTITMVHKWAMLDVFVLATVVLALSSASAWNATLLDGFYWFLGYFFLAGVLGLRLAKQLASPRPTATKALSNALLLEKA